jgi:hypothetical protein
LKLPVLASAIKLAAGPASAGVFYIRLNQAVQEKPFKNRHMTPIQKKLESRVAGILPI